jgi:hypothetical protein
MADEKSVKRGIEIETENFIFTKYCISVNFISGINHDQAKGCSGYC